MTENALRHDLERLAEKLDRARHGDADEPAEASEQYVQLPNLIGELLAATFQGSSRSEADGTDDERGEVTATVDGTGRLQQLEICPYAMRDMDHRALSAACTRAIRAARVELESALEDQLSTILGANPPSLPENFDSNTAFDVAGEVAWRRWS